MRCARKIASVRGVVGLAVAVALALTWLGADGEAKDEVLQALDPVENAPTDQVRHIDWEALPDEVIAWVEVPGTAIDEPIVQADASSPDFYLYADVFGEGGYGTPYIDCECTLGTPFVLAYGHHMDDGSVFADFASFSDAAFAQEHQTVYLHTREDNRRHVLSVFAADVVNASYETVHTDVAADKLAARVVSICEASDAVIFEPADPTQVFAFATCSYQTRNSRTVVYAVEVGDEA